jgi:hypothetical protein
VRVFDITDPRAVTELSPSVEPGGKGYALSVSAPAGAKKGRRLLTAFTEERVERPSAVVANRPSNLGDAAQGADLVIISHRNFIQSVAPLAGLRRSQGLGVSVVDVEDVYDEFSYGAHTPQAVKDFLFYAANHWSKAPRFVLLVGDASSDPRNYLGLGDQDFVPTKLLDTVYIHTASDDWLADFDGDRVPEMAVGRLPVGTPAEAERVVAKIVAYSPGSASASALFVADQQGTYPFSFEQENKEVSALIPGSLSVKYVNRASAALGTVRAQLIGDINQGPLLVNYSGHGSVNAWSGDNLFTSADASGLANGNRLPLFVMMTCLSGYYLDAQFESLSESLLKSPNGGAVAVWASTGLTVPFGQSLMNRSLYETIFGAQPPTIGEAVQKAKASTTDADVRATWVLFGDPTMRIR